MITSRTSELSPQTRHNPRFAARVESSADVEGPALVLDGPGGEREVINIPVGWSRIGRSPAAEIRLDSPTVSRRHALIIRTAEGKLQIIDDRSLTGIELNGEPVRWSELDDGDELRIGGVRMIVAKDYEPARAL
jgi:pSer/pThr/pTyr-binding forkhead associated (FHA) protein